MAFKGTIALFANKKCWNKSSKDNWSCVKFCSSSLYKKTESGNKAHCTCIRNRRFMAKKF